LRGYFAVSQARTGKVIAGTGKGREMADVQM